MFVKWAPDPDPVLVQDIQFLRIRSGSGSDSKALKIVAHTYMYNLSSQSVLSFQQVSPFMGSLIWALGLITLGCLHLRPKQPHFHSSYQPVLCLHHRVNQTSRSFASYFGSSRISLSLLLKSLYAISSGYYNICGCLNKC